MSFCARNVRALQILRIHHGESITGSLPDAIGCLVAIQILEVQHVSLRGSLPPAFGYLLALRHFTLISTDVKGSLPDEIGCWISTILTPGEGGEPQIGELFKNFIAVVFENI